MKIVLELQDQPSNIKKVTVRHDIVIGRGAECNLRLSAPQVSRRHCFLRIGSAGAFVSDLDSSNGTTLDGNKLTSGKRYPLLNGAVLAIGPVKFVAHLVSEVAASEVVDVAASGSHSKVSEVERVSIPDSGNFDETIADYVPDDDGSSMNFAIEQDGSVAGEDEPTADCVVDHAYVASVKKHEPLIVVAEELIADEDVLEELDEVVEFVDDDEVLLVDEDDVDETDLETAPDSNVANAGDSVESELKNFLQGLD